MIVQLATQNSGEVRPVIGFILYCLFSVFLPAALALLLALGPQRALHRPSTHRAPSPRRKSERSRRKLISGRRRGGRDTIKSLACCLSLSHR